MLITALLRDRAAHKRLIVAIHEAGHIAVALHFRFQLKSATLSPDDPRLEGLTGFVDEMIETAERSNQYLLAVLAGLAANGLWTPDIDLASAVDSDLKLAHKIVSHFGDYTPAQAQAYVKRQTDAAFELFRSHEWLRNATLAIADELYGSDGQVQGWQLAELFNQYRPRP